MVIYIVILSGWWFGTMDFYDFPIILGISSSQLKIRPSFFRGVGLNHQPVMGQMQVVVFFSFPSGRLGCCDFDQRGDGSVGGQFPKWP